MMDEVVSDRVRSMETAGGAAGFEDAEMLYLWTARKLRPVVLLYVAGVFAGCIALAFFVVGSAEAVKALLMAAVGVLIPLIPAVASRLDFRLTRSRLERRPHSEAEPKDFDTVFEMADLDRVVPVRSGFRYVKALDAANALDRFRKLHLSDRYSGEVQVGDDDRATVLGLLSDFVGRPEATDSAR
jgi:hypothetical protein